VTDTYEIVLADASRLDEVRPLFIGMVEHHRRLTGGQWPVRDSDEAWQLRKRQYSSWLSSGHGWLLLALDRTSATGGAGRQAPPGAAAGTPPSRGAAGYALARLTDPGPTWDLGTVIGNLESLSVAEHARSQGA